MAKQLVSYQEVLGINPSKYQEEIFDFIRHGTGNGVIKARAGCGKTATLIACMKLLPEKKQCLFLAFNTSVKDEISTKMVGYKNCKVSTLHGLGSSILRSYLKQDFTLDDNKYRAFLRNNFETITNKNVFGSKRNDLIDKVIDLLKFSRLDLAQSTREIKNCAKHHGIIVDGSEEAIVYKLLNWGKKELSVVDYTDLIWLPNELDINANSAKYDWIFNDEAQDYSIAAVKLFMKCFKRGSRFVSCGDEFQSINQFAGASDRAFELMINHPNTKIFNLPISYRCDTKIIEEAHRFVSDIQSKENADLGVVKVGTKVSDIDSDDMVLSRTNAPLFKLYARLIRMGKPCYIKGQDNDKEKLLSFIKRYNHNDKLGLGFKEDGLFPRMYKAMIDERNELVKNGMDIVDANNHISIQAMYDKIATIDILANNCDCVDCLIEKINNIFNKTEDGICLTTIHKAKGLECNNVHILCASELTGKYAHTEDELQQEKNLFYVAITRAKHKLCYISEKDFPPSKIFSNEDDGTTEFDYIESCVCKLYKMEPVKPINNIGVSKIRLQNSTKITSVHKNDNKKVINNQTTKPKTKLIDKLFE